MIGFGHGIALGSSLALAVLLSGCAHETAADRAPRPDPVARLAPAGESIWRENLGDPALADLLRRADLGALDVKIALARLERAQAEVDLAGAAAGPRLEAGVAGALGGRTFASRRAVGAPTLEATYDFDVSGRIARLRQAAASEWTASAAEVAGARLLVGAETARAYVGLCAAQDELAAAGRRQTAAGRSMTLVRARLAEGLATGPDVETQVAALDAATGAAQAARLAARSQAARLAALTGGPPLPEPAPAPPPAPPPAPCALPDLPPASQVVAADLGDGRPEVQAALARLQAADFRRAAAVAAERPQFLISAVIGAPDAAIATLLDTRALAWALAGRIGETLLDAGAGRARIRAAASEADLADLAYRKTVLQGWTELRIAAMTEVAADERLAAARRADVRAQARLGVAQARHDQGATDGLALAQAREGLEQAHDLVRQARLGAAEARIARGLAGGGR